MLPLIAFALATWRVRAAAAGVWTAALALTAQCRHVGAGAAGTAADRAEMTHSGLGLSYHSCAMGNSLNAFISYARADGVAFADAVQSQLALNGFHTWRDTSHLDALADFSVEIESAIAAADVVVVCISPSIAHASDSFVRREILYAQARGRPIVPLRLAGAEVPILIVQLTWIEVPSAQGIDRALGDEIRRRLRHASTRLPFQSEPDPSVVFARGLIEDIVSMLEATTTVLLDLAASGWSVPRRLKGALPSSMLRAVHRPIPRTLSPGILGQELGESQVRVVLHGEAGGGKTTALLIAAREAANAWLEDPRRRLPIFCRAEDWNAAIDEPVVDWLSRSASLLPKDRLQAALASGGVALFVDGLDELPSRITRDKIEVNPRAELLGRLPSKAAVLVSLRTEALKQGADLLAGFEQVVLEPISQAQVAAYAAQVPHLGELLERDAAWQQLVHTPLTLGLLAYIVTHPLAGSEVEVSAEKLSPRLRLVFDFSLGRWQHEKQRDTTTLDLGVLLSVLGRLATWSGSFSREQCEAAAKVDGAHGAAILDAATRLGLVRATAPNAYAFFHPLFADCYATLHCWKHLGANDDDGWDGRLFRRIAELGDTAFVRALLPMTYGFWRGEYGDEVATALGALASAEDPDAVDALVRLADRNLDIGRGGWVHNFASRANRQVVDRFVQALRPHAATSIESIHQLAGLGEPGVAALLAVYGAIVPTNPMRGQIASYTLVRDRLAED